MCLRLRAFRNGHKEELISRKGFLAPASCARTDIHPRATMVRLSDLRPYRVRMRYSDHHREPLCGKNIAAKPKHLMSSIDCRRDVHNCGALVPLKRSTNQMLKS